MENELVITFNSTHQAMKAEDEFKQAELDFELIPTPRKISAECGFALLVRNTQPMIVKKLCDQTSIQFDLIYVIKNDKGEKYYEKSY